MAVSNYNELRSHIGHDVVCVGYAQKNKETGKPVDPWQNVALECETCSEVLLDFDIED